MPYNPHDDKFTLDSGREGTAADEHKLVLLTAAKRDIKEAFETYAVEASPLSSNWTIAELIRMFKSLDATRTYINACNNSVTAHWIIHRYICELLQSYICGKTFVPADAKEG